jgi:hypothetical protein
MSDNLYVLTTEPDSLSGGTYATVDDDGHPVIQFFRNKDDALRYVVQLEAIGAVLFVSETPEDNVDKFCDLNDQAYSIVEEGEVVIPRLETLYNVPPTK